MRAVRRLFALVGLVTLVGVIGVPVASVSSKAFAATVVPRVRIDRIEITGVRAVSEVEIEAALEIDIGDTLDHRRVARTARNIQALYRMHGYEQVRVDTELSRSRTADGKQENVIQIEIAEGLPIRIAAIRVVPEKGAKAVWGDRSSMLGRRIELGPGDILDQDRLSSARRVIQDMFAADEYLGAKVDEVVVTPTSALPNGAEAERWVDVEIRVDPGDRVTFGFRGNTIFARPRLMALIEEQRLLGFGRDYVSEIRSRIESTYKDAGYARVRVEAFTFEGDLAQERHVTYIIDEGKRVRIGAIGFDGNIVYDSQTLRREFMSRGPTLTQRGYYSETEIQKSAELLIEWIRSQGYLSAKLVTINETYDASANSVKLLVYLYEGDSTLVDSVDLEGVSAIPLDQALDLLGVHAGEALNLFAFNEGLEAFKARYRAIGHLDAKILNEAGNEVVVYEQDNRLARIHLKVQEGPLYRVSRIETEGLTGTKPEVVLRELEFSEGDVLEEPAVTESEARLRKLGIFSVVTIRAIDDLSNPGFKIVRVSVQEGTPGLVAGGIGYRNDLGIRVFGQTGYSNLWGQGHGLSLLANANRRFDEDFCNNFRDDPSNTDPIFASTSCYLEYQVQLGYAWPWFAGIKELTFRPQFTVERTQYEILDVNAITLSSTWERPIFHHPNLVGGLTYSLERVQQFNAKDSAEDGTIRIGSITPTLRLDLRDNPLLPTRGFFATSSFEFADPAFLSQSDPYPIGYTRWQFRGDLYLPLFGGDVVFYSSFRTGLERNTQAPPDSQPGNRAYRIPLSKQFVLGGVGSLRGFLEQELNYDELAIRGLLSYVNYRFQLDLPFSGALRFGPFLDAGNLLVDRYSFGSLLYSSGIGFHFQSPVGPVNFDWGFKLNPPANSKTQHRFHFSIGVI